MTLVRTDVIEKDDGELILEGRRHVAGANALSSPAAVVAQFRPIAKGARWSAIRRNNVKVRGAGQTAARSRPHLRN